MKRNILSMLVASILGVLSSPILSPGALFAAEVGSSGKPLVAYFSWSGNTREIASQIHKQAGGDLFEIRVVDTYPRDYKACTDRAKAEQNSGARPELSGSVEDIASYDVVFIGYPSWWGTIPMALFTFLEQYDFSGKRIVPFCTHGGGGIGRSLQDIASLCPNSEVLEEIAIRGDSAKSAQGEVSAWLDRIGVAN